MNPTEQKNRSEGEAAAPRPARRRTPVRRVDLHTHTNASDGEHTPEELIALARARGLDVIALTDHDTTAGVERALAAAAGAGDIELIPGVELSTDVPGYEIHVLGYFVDWRDPDFQVMLNKFRDGRIGRAEKIVAKLIDLGAPVSFERVKELAGDANIGRPHIARVLLEAGHVTTIQEAFDKYLANDKPAYVEHYSLPPAEAVKLIRSAGGTPVYAHPRGATQFVPELVKAGLLGLECYYAQYDEREQQELVAVAKQYGLIATGGSDFHGLHKMGHMNKLGEAHVPPEVVEQLERAHIQIESR
ncbi:MAG: PHP domain-containing protein [Anaerolineae bacterium]